ncbi:30S ribosomal protein S12 methylthiotransferase RimO [bacterium]|nr:MAG: 30S ribosomal protein S12 methylthiotransferase RimO [bacterium]
MKISVVSLGCSKNLVDTEVMLGYLARSGCQVVDQPEGADCVLINTCSFLTEAVEESLDRIFELVQLKKAGGVRRLVVTGCAVSRYGENLLEEIPEIDALVHPKSLDEVGEAVTGVPVVDNLQSTFPERLLSFPSHRAYLKVGEGCSNHCTYCMIPGLRGEFESRSTSSVIEETRWLLNQGVREITLVSQDTGRFGVDSGDKTLAKLIRSTLLLPGKYWLRVLYIHPSRVDVDLLSVLNTDDRISRYLDVPFQHVSKEVLERMGRGSAPHPLDVLDLIRRHLPDVFVRTTLMTGFPGESAADFSEMIQFVKEAGIHHLGVFPYSREHGTPAASLDDQIAPELARERAQLLIEEQEKVSRLLLRELVGKELEALGEGDDEGGSYGRHKGQAPEVDGVVRFDRPVPPGEFVRVRITDSDVYDLHGIVLGEKDPEDRS